MRKINWLENENRIKRRRKHVLELVRKRGKDEFLKELLKLMSARVYREQVFKEIVKDFNAVYVFQGQKKGAYIVAEFKNNQIYLSKKRIKQWDFRVYFKNEKYLYKFILGEDGEYQEAVREEEVEYNGNLNYMRRFTFMARMMLENEVNFEKK